LPNPISKVFGKAVGMFAAVFAKHEILAGYVHHLVIVSVTLQQNLAERKKRRVRQAVILQDDPFLHVAEKPVDGSTDGNLTSQVFLAEHTSTLQSQSI
jgi:hypothetical protein